MREDEPRARARELHAGTPQTLSGLLATVQGNVSAQTLRAAQMSPLSQVPLGVPHLRFSLANCTCLLPLDRLAGVLAAQYRLVHLPHSPEWVLGIFPHRTTLVALVDPLPVLAGSTEGPPSSLASVPRPLPVTAPVVILGGGERMLAWRVTEIADISYIREGDARPPVASGLPPSPRIAMRYIAGILATEPETPADLVLNVDQALDDMLAAMEEEDALG